jgi:hypothetical protein
VEARSLRVSLVVTALLAAPMAPLRAQPPPASLTPDQAREIAIETYLYAYPLVIGELTRRLGVAGPEGAATNQFHHRRTLPDARSLEALRPAADTLSSTLWFDVGREPLIIRIPAAGDRHVSLQMTDLWSDVFATPGPRTTGPEAQEILLTSADWRGVVPRGALLVRSPTPVGCVLVRTQTRGGDDLTAAHRFQDGVTAAPLGPAGKAAPARKPEARTSFVARTRPVDQVAALGAGPYFELFAELLRRNPPHANDHAIVHRMARLGLEPGRPFSFAAARPEVRQALEAAVAPAMQIIRAPLKRRGATQNGWRLTLGAVGSYGTDYRARAVAAHEGFGASPVEDAVVALAVTDERGRPLASDGTYVLHFSREQLPPVHAFWTLTLYDDRQLLAANPIDRHALLDPGALTFNPDGSVDIYVQRASPGKTREANWLPAPATNTFTVALRLYWPKAEVLNGTWAPPPLRPAAPERASLTR